MKRYNIFYFIWEALKGMKRNGVMTFASIAVLLSCLLVIGGFSLIVFNIDLNLNQLGNLNEMVAFCEPDADDETVARIKDELSALENVDELIHSTKSEQLKKLQEENFALYGDITEEENPLSDSFTISYHDNSKVPELDYQIRQIEGIRKVRNNLELANKIESLKHGIMLVFIWFLVILFVVSIFVIINTIKLAVYSRKSEITVMRFVGATNSFITLPFVFEGVIIGGAASALAFALQSYIYIYIEKMAAAEMQMITVLNYGQVWPMLAVGFVAIGVLTGVIGSVASLNKYLKY